MSHRNFLDSIVNCFLWLAGWSELAADTLVVSAESPYGAAGSARRAFCSNSSWHAITFRRRQRPFIVQQQFQWAHGHAPFLSLPHVSADAAHAAHASPSCIAHDASTFLPAHALAA